MTEWYEDFFDGLYGTVLARQFDDARTLEQARTVKRLLRLRRGQRALDVPCGMGRITFALAHMGIVVTGVDLTARYIRRARRTAGREGLAVRFIRRDMREIDFDSEFHGVFNWFTSFGYFSDADNRAFLERAFRALRPGGRFLVDVVNKSRVLAHFRRGNDCEIGGVRIVQRHRWNPRTSRVLSDWTFTKGGVTERHSISVRAFNGTEMRRLLRSVGFREIELFGDWSHAGRFSRHSRRLIAVGRRPIGRH